MPRITKSEKIPPAGTAVRSVLISNITNFPSYKESLEKGYPLFTEEELKEIKMRYKDGLVWDEIQRELLLKKIILKKATFRKYIQEKHLPSATGYRKVDRRRLAVFPPDIISHINFIRYFYEVVDGKVIDRFLETLLEQTQMTYLEAIEAELPSTNIYPAICYRIGWDDGEVDSAIEKILFNREEDKTKVLAMLEDIDKTFKSEIDTKISKLISFLQKKYISIPEIPDEDKA